MHYDTDVPKVLPVAITEQLGTSEQRTWIEAAYCVYRNDCVANVGKTRSMLNRGIEVVRCIGFHELDVKMLVVLANIFAERAKQLSNHAEVRI